jgi:general secretion pathway protein G
VGARRERGVTYLELVAVATIVSILAAAVLPVGKVAVKRQRELELRRALREIRTAIDAHKQASDDGRIVKRTGESGYPKRLEDLVEGVDDEKNPKRERIYFLRRLPRDPLVEDGKWGLRSYASPPDDPREGEDVFDVYTLAEGKGINGRPYREW